MDWESSCIRHIGTIGTIDGLVWLSMLFKRIQTICILYGLVQFRKIMNMESLDCKQIGTVCTGCRFVYIIISTNQGVCTVGGLVEFI